MDSSPVTNGHGRPPERALVERESAIWSRATIEDIQVKAELGHYRIRGFSTLRKDLPGFDDLTFIPSSTITSAPALAASFTS